MKGRSFRVPADWVNELRELLRMLHVTGVSDARFGKHYSVYAHPSPCPLGHAFNVLVSVRVNGQQMPQDIVDIPLMLQDGGGTFWLGSGPTEIRGQVWFRELLPGEYHAVADQTRLMQLILPEQISMVARSQSSTRPHLILTEDRSVKAVLEQSVSSDRAALSLSTRRRELEHARVRYNLGADTGVTGPLLESTRLPGLLETSCELSQAFASAVTCVPRFEILPERRS